MVRNNVALQLLVHLVWPVETSDVDGRGYLAWAWFCGRLRPARLDLQQAATRY
jgi:hypothetical protein